MDKQDSILSVDEQAKYAMHFFTLGQLRLKQEKTRSAQQWLKKAVEQGNVPAR
jgi:hypothetical protein